MPLVLIVGALDGARAELVTLTHVAMSRTREPKECGD